MRLSYFQVVESGVHLLHPAEARCLLAQHAKKPLTRPVHTSPALPKTANRSFNNARVSFHNSENCMEKPELSAEEVI